VLFDAEKLAQDSIQIAQWEGDDSYDPFADYSEFEETEDEEADINFFRNGRLFTIQMSANYRGYTGNLGNIYETANGFGVFLTYFFDLRFALMVGFGTGESALTITGPTETASTTGTVSISAITFNIKYYINTQNVSRGLATMNPYLIGGITQFHRTQRLVDLVEEAKDSAVGADIGAGIEIPLLRGQLYFGIQGVYHYVNFADENQEIILDGDAVNGATGITPDGDLFSFSASLGVNF
jgi:hypothetical protein